MWIIIVLLVLGFILFKIFDRDFILAQEQKSGNYLVKFESGLSPMCELVDVFNINDKKYYVFIPVESLRAIPDEDIIVLKCIRKKSDGNLAFVFADGEPCEQIFKTIKTKYSHKYKFIE